MKYSTRLSDAVHLLLFIHLEPDADLSSAAIAASIHTNPACVRQMMSRLREAGLLRSTQGRARPSLARDIGEITLLDVYRAVEEAIVSSLYHAETITGRDGRVRRGLREFLDRLD